MSQLQIQFQRYKQQVKIGVREMLRGNPVRTGACFTMYSTRSRTLDTDYFFFKTRKQHCLASGRSEVQAYWYKNGSEREAVRKAKQTRG